MKSFKYFLKEYLRKYRRYLCESVGLDWYSRPALYEMDRKLEKYMPYRNGFFIEAGANDGFAQSNTYYFEKFLNWRGILVEPIPELYRKCVKERPHAIVINCALVSDDYQGRSVSMLYSNLMSLVKGAQGSDLADLEHISRGMEIQAIKETYEIEVPARTLNSILDEVGVDDIDLFSLDVEGYELEVLKGIDLTKYRPKYILVEVRSHQEMEGFFAEHGYEAVDRLSCLDVLYRRVNDV